MAARSGILCLALFVAVAAILGPVPLGHPGSSAGPAPLRLDAAVAQPAARLSLSADDDPATFECDDSDTEDGPSPQAGPESAASDAVFALRPPSASAAVFRSAGDPLSIEYLSKVFRPPAA